MAAENRKSIFWELAIVTAGLLVATHVLYILRGNALVAKSLSTAVAVLFLYVPILMLWIKKRPIDFLDWSIKAFSRSLGYFLISSIIIFPLFFVGAYFWQMYVMGYKTFVFATFPNILNVSLFQILLIALPEEFYFRGYFQTMLNRVWLPRWRILGTGLGYPWIITALVFAFAHSIVYYQWWHFSIFFPALVFGYLRERTGSITAPILFHAVSNIAMDWLGRSFG